MLPTALTTPSPRLLRSPYFVARNTRGSLPVYTDIRNGGTRHLILVRNVDGNISVLARDLSHQLFPKDSREASRIKVDIVHSRHLVITGGRWKTEVVGFLKQRGF